MNPQTIIDKLTGVLEQIQSLSGEDCPPINGDTKPTKDLPEFDSKMWPVATGMLASSLGATIPYDMNIFRDKQTKAVRTMNEIGAFLAHFLNQSTSVAAE